MMKLICGWLRIDNKIRDEAAEVIGEILKENETLTLLNLGGDSYNNSK